MAGMGRGIAVSTLCVARGISAYFCVLFLRLRIDECWQLVDACVNWSQSGPGWRDAIPGRPLVTWNVKAEEGKGMRHGMMMLALAIAAQAAKPAEKARDEAPAEATSAKLQDAHRLLRNGRYAEAEEALAAVEAEASKKPAGLKG